MKITSLKKRVLVWFGTVVGIILLLFSISFQYFMNQNIENNIKARLHTDTIEILNDFQKNGHPPPDYELYAEEMMIFKNTRLIYNSISLTMEEIYRLLENKINFQSYKNSNNKFSSIYILKDENFIIIVYKIDIDDKMETFAKTLLFLDLILLLLLLFTASILIDKILLPIKNITKTAGQISINNFSNIIESPQQDDELKELVSSFNKMILRLKDGVENLDKFNNDVSHELKTPLTVIQGEIEITLRKLREPQEYQKSMQIVYYEAKQMQSIVENLLLLTQYSPQNIQQSFQKCQLDLMLLEVIDKFYTQIQAKRLNVKLKKLETISIEVNKILFYSIFSNLLDNAIKYTPKEKNIYLSLYSINTHVYFQIQDEGIGIKTADLPKLTHRFYRVDASRNKEIKGFGLGLSIVKNSIELHKGTLQITSQVNLGTTVLLSL